MSVKATLELDVEMTCVQCVKKIHEALSSVETSGNIRIDLAKQQVLVETNLPYTTIINAIEKTGRKAVLKGYGGKHLGAAVVEFLSRNGVMGVVRFVQADIDKCIIDGTIDGLPCGEHGLHIHEYGDLSKCYDRIGSHFNPENKQHGGPDDAERHYGDLGNITADEDGRATFRKEDEVVKVWDIIGRSLVITANKDDLGRGGTPNSKVDGNSGEKLACGVIARSAGLFENPKRICLCEGVTVWDERAKAIAKEATCKFSKH